MDVLGAATRGRCTASAVLGRLRVEGANAPAPTASAKMETLRIVVRCSLRLLWVISGLAHAVPSKTSSNDGKKAGDPHAEMTDTYAPGGVQELIEESSSPRRR